MQDPWLELVDLVLRPARPDLERCRREGELHRAALRAVSDVRARALASVQERIEEARAVVFATDDGVVPARMTDLEREWRLVSRPDPEGGSMDLWARLAPPTWIDRKRWRDSDPAARFDAAIALAADVTGVEAAEAAIGSFRTALAAWGARIEPRIRWRLGEGDADCVTPLLAEPVRAAREAITGRDPRAVAFQRAEDLRRAVLERMSSRLPERPLLGQAIAHAAAADFLLRAARLGERPNPVPSLFGLWSTGYALAAVDPSGVTLEIPPA